VTTLTSHADGDAGRAGVAVQLIDLHRHYGPVRALDGLTLDIEPGELVALLGPSGCGKTTALRSLAGLDEPDSGRVVVGGRDITHVPANRRDMGVVFQAYSLFPNMSARDNVAYGLRLRGIEATERYRRVDELLDLVGLGHHAAHYPHQLSGGQQQRVALARALAIRPQVLLLDEPLSALDAKVRRQLREEIRRIQLMVGTTTLFVTHDQEEALALGDRVGVMSAGRLEQIAPPAELYDRPRTAFVAEFVGLTNRLPGLAHEGMVNVLDSEVPLLDGSAGARARRRRGGSSPCRELPGLALPGPGGCRGRNARRGASGRAGSTRPPTRRHGRDLASQDAGLRDRCVTLGRSAPRRCGLHRRVDAGAESESRWRRPGFDFIVSPRRESGGSRGPGRSSPAGEDPASVLDVG
jgi:putative spermidine/putrescine transport system ATP-binding protein